MKLTYSIVLSSVVSLAFMSTAFATSQERETEKAEKEANIAKTLSTYKACDFDALTAALQAVKLDNKTVFKVSDKITEASSYYYEVKDDRSGIYDTNLVRSNVCEYVIKNTCSVYWNNVMATAKIAPVALDKIWISPPVNVLSPLVGCKSVKPM
jgi:hypothetical protein